MAVPFIVLEGGEGAGKSTQAALLSEWMDRIGVRHVLTREPGGTAVGEAIREIVLGRGDMDIPAETELLLILAARSAFVASVVRPALDEGMVVLADRFSPSTVAYQGYGRGLPMEDVRAGIHISTGGLVPDLCVVLDVPVEEGAERQQRSGADPDRIESAGHDFLGRVRDGYRAYAEAEEGAVMLDARGTPTEVHERIRDLLIARFPETFSK